MTEEIGAVRGDVDDQPVVGERHGLQQRRAGRRVGVELQDAVVLLAETELAGGAEHALGDFAAELGRSIFIGAPPLPWGTLVPTRAKGYACRR